MRLIGIHGKARSGKDEFCRILCETYGFKRIAFADVIRKLAVKYFEVPQEETLDKKTKDSRRILQGIGACVRNGLTKTKAILFSGPLLVGDNPMHLKIGVSGFPIWVEKMATAEFGIEVVDLKRKLKYNRIVFNGIVEMWNETIESFSDTAEGTDENIWVNHLLNSCTSDVVHVIPDVRFLNEYKMLGGLALRSDKPSYGKAVKIFRIDNPTIEAGATHISETNLDNVTEWDFSIVNEHKTDWRERLVLSAANMVRKFKYEGFFLPSDIEKFKINLDEH